MDIFRLKRFVPRLTTLVSSFLVCSLLLAALPAGLAFAGDCDGTVGDDDVTCSADPTVPDDVVGLDLGDDVYIQDAGVTSLIVDGDGLEDGTAATGNGGNDLITINGTVTLCVNGDNVTGNGGNDTITINGVVLCSVNGDGGATDNGGDDYIEINGLVTGAVSGDYTFGDGGDDIIVINGEVDDVTGDDTFGSGGDDLIIIEGTVNFDINGDFSSGAGGNDVVIIGTSAIVLGTIYGDDGRDTLIFQGISQADLDALALDPASGTLTIGANTYVWLDFESLRGFIEQLIASGVRVFFAGSSVIAAESDDGLGISVITEHGRVALIAYSALDGLDEGEAALRFQTSNSAGWYVTVANLGANPAHPDHDLMQVQIFNAAGSMVAQFTFSF